MTISKKKGNARLGALRLHRLLEFERVFNLYLDGKATGYQVSDRAEKMLKVGLPKLK